jgi:hypothetical protein
MIMDLFVAVLFKNTVSTEKLLIDFTVVNGEEEKVIVVHHAYYPKYLYPY